MGENSKIEWTDRTWNPITGCTRVSAGCDNCYAVKMTKRLEAMGQAEKYGGLVNIGKGHFNGVVKCHEEALLQPLKWRKPQRIFVNSMSDVFHKDVPFEFIDKMFAVMALCPHLTFQVLTKRPERAAEYFADSTLLKRQEDDWMTVKHSGTEKLGAYEFTWPLPNVWIGTSVEDQKSADERIPHLLRIPAKVRFLSCEPLLGPVGLSWFKDTRDPHIHHFPLSGTSGDGIEGFDGPAIHWVIAGGESGSNARPMHPDWARSLRDQCVAAGVPFFFKQWGEWRPMEDSDHDSTVVKGWPDEHGNLEPRDKWVAKVGRHKAGRVLDGRTWDEFPVVGS